MWECNVGREPRHIELLYPSLPELICAAVEILVAEKREKAKKEAEPTDTLPRWDVGVNGNWQLILPGNRRPGAVGEESRRITVCWSSAADRECIKKAFEKREIDEHRTFTYTLGGKGNAVMCTGGEAALAAAEKRAKAEPEAKPEMSLTDLAARLDKWALDSVCGSHVEGLVDQLADELREADK